MDPLAILSGKPGHRVAHKPKGKPYAFGSNREFVRDEARDKSTIGVDIDTTESEEGTPHWNHWSQFIKKDAWFDPRHRLGNGARIEQCSDAQLRRIKVKYQGANRPMLTANAAASICHTVRGGPLVPCFEIKGLRDDFFDPDWYREHFLPMQERGWGPVIMALPGVKTSRGAAGLRKLRAADLAGLPTMYLWRAPVAASVLRNAGVDLVKSQRGRPAMHRP